MPDHGARGARGSGARHAAGAGELAGLRKDLHPRVGPGQPDAARRPGRARSGRRPRSRVPAGGAGAQPLAGDVQATTETTRWHGWRRRDCPGAHRRRVVLSMRWGAIEHAAPQHGRPRSRRDDAPRDARRAGRGGGGAHRRRRRDHRAARRGPVTQAFAVRATAGRRGKPAARRGAPRALLLAFRAGSLLNAMPCVLPVLSVKTLALVRHAGAARAATAAHGLVYTLGVLGSFAALAGGLLALRAGGEQHRLGVPAPVALVRHDPGLLLFTMGLDRSRACCHISSRLGGVGHGLAARDGYAGSFFTGALAPSPPRPAPRPSWARRSATPSRSPGPRRC